MLSPLLRTVAQSASMLPNGEGEFFTRFFVEHLVEARLARRRRKPEVDYMIQWQRTLPDTSRSQKYDLT